MVVAVASAAAVLALAVAKPPGCGGGFKASEAVLRTDLRTFRDVLAQYRSDKGESPSSLFILVKDNYLRAIPVDPMTKSSATWVPTFASPGGGIVDVHSSSTKRGSDGRRYSEW